MTSFPLIISLKVLSPNTAHSEVLVLRTSMQEFGGIQLSSEQKSATQKILSKINIKMLSLLASKRMLIKGKI